MEAFERAIWPKKITVDKRIVSILSQSTYDSFPRALKELVLNSFDADSKEVYIDIDLVNEKVTIKDDGRGMDEADFEFYLRIAGKTRKKEDNRSPAGRHIIGQFGVGFLSIFPFFKNYNIESKKVGTNTILYASIPLYKYFSDDNRLVDIGNILIDGGKKDENDSKNQSFTTITLSGFNDLTRAFFHSDIPEKYDKSLVETYKGIDKIKWILADDLPISFRSEKFNKIFNYEESIPFNVFVNNDKLYRETYGEEILETQQGDYKQIGKIKCKYCILTSRKSVKPFKARYLKIRNLNVGVGDEREHFGIAHGATRSRIHWLTGEVHIIEGMNDLIKVSRDGFNYNKDYEDLKVFFNNRLNYFSNRLESEDELKREIKQTGKQFRINNLKLLNPDIISNKIKKLENEGYKINPIEENGIKHSQPVISISEEKKEISLSNQFEGFEKHIIIKGRKYNVNAATWDYKSDFFPACKLEDNKLIINTSYPLFDGKKYTDIFVKLHLLLLINYLEKNITDVTFELLVKDILNYYSDYLK